MTFEVAWNLLWLRPGVVGGSEEYATRQLRALADHARDQVRVTAFVLAPFVDAYPDLAQDVRCVVARLDGRNKPLRVAAETTWLAARTRRGFDAVHHLGGRIPQVAPGRRVLTIHDIQPLEQPENFSPVKRRFLARALPRSVARASQVITPSEHVRARVIDRFGLDPAHVHAVAAPVMVREHESDEGAGSVPSAMPAEIRSLLRDDTPFFVYPAITYAHKNHGVLLDAFARVRAAHPQVRLVLSGGPGGADAAVSARVAQPDLAGAVLRPGRVDRVVLDALLAHAVALTFPSRYEGFGLPVVEALAARCPVIAADATALGEVVGSAGVLVEPDDVGAWASALDAALTVPGYRAAHADAGVLVARRYSATTVAASLVEVYRQAASGW
jgi:glycosyltransferase involved in cell wall biosynthesis